MLNGLKLLMVGLGAIAAPPVALLAYWLLRPNRSRVDPQLEIETWDAVADGLHNSNTDMIWWRDHFYLIHAASPFHMGSTRCTLVVRRSRDARTWEKLAELNIPGEDIRDPKFALIGDRLFLYALPNKGLRALPYGTVYSISDDGVRWSPFETIDHPGWLFWRPKTRDGVRWYVAAYWHRHGKSILLTSTDGVHWTIVSQINDGEGNDETDIEFLPDGRLLATARLEVTPDNPWGNPDASTLIAVAAPPYTEWHYAKSQVTRLDGPALFAHAGRLFAVARYQPGRRGRYTQLGGVFSRKRTALFAVEADRLVYLSDFPSASDTSYAGVVLRDGCLYASYYTSNIRRDYPWIVGMLVRSDIRIAKLPLTALLQLAP
ncbi:MAG: exo-alpha-sialidase [Deltaproteobacteria bacterium]|nr:exo-alpha-sialidase [Deltaproteobacteria bacterium]MBI3388381.1 exo-alpha-sialidase [Deltaproteobacteria bacterium]